MHAVNKDAAELRVMVGALLYYVHGPYGEAGLAGRCQNAHTMGAMQCPRIRPECMGRRSYRAGCVLFWHCLIGVRHKKAFIVY